ncbi:endonuclease [Aeromicrobium sp.]
MSNKSARWVKEFGTTYAEDAGIVLRDKPSPLWRLLVLTLLLSKRIDADIAVRSARELSRAGWRTPRRMLDSTWQQRVDTLGRGGYRRYDESTSTRLAEAAQLVIDRWRGDLRRLHDEAGSDANRVASLVQEVKGIGPVGAAIFLREVQGVWTDLSPFVDELAAEGARLLGLPTTASRLAREVPPQDFHRLVAACVRAALDDRTLEAMMSAS